MRQFCFFYLWIYSASAKLVVDQAFLDKMDGEIIKTEGELVNTTYREHSRCPNVEEKVELFKFYTIDEDGDEVENLFELATTIDIHYNTDKIHNYHERWIWAYIYIRFWILGFKCFDH